MKWIKSYSTILTEVNGNKELDDELLGAVVKEGPEKIKSLLSKGANPNAKDYYENTPLIFATWNHRNEVVRTLIENGANVNLTDVAKQSALHFASWNGNTEIIEMLLDNGASIDLITNAGHTPLYYAIRFKQPEVAKFLILRGANPGKVQEEIDAWKALFRGDFSWYPGGEAAFERKIKAAETRRKLF